MQEIKDNSDDTLAAIQNCAVATMSQRQQVTTSFAHFQLISRLENMDYMTVSVFTCLALFENPGVIMTLMTALLFNSFRLAEQIFKVFKKVGHVPSNSSGLRIEPRSKQARIQTVLPRWRHSHPGGLQPAAQTQYCPSKYLECKDKRQTTTILNYCSLPLFAGCV